jgi:hypothetical protein
MAFDKDHDALKREFSANLQAFGQNGFKIVGNSMVEGEFVAITALEDSVISAFIPVGMSPAADVPVSLPMPKGVTIYGKFIGVISESGKVIAYNLTEG